MLGYLKRGQSVPPPTAPGSTRARNPPACESSIPRRMRPSATCAERRSSIRSRRAARAAGRRQRSLLRYDRAAESTRTTSSSTIGRRGSSTSSRWRATSASAEPRNRGAAEGDRHRRSRLPKPTTSSGSAYRDSAGPGWRVARATDVRRLAPAMLHAREELADLTDALGRTDERLTQLEALVTSDPGRGARSRSDLPISAPASSIARCRRSGARPSSIPIIPTPTSRSAASGWRTRRREATASR